MTSTVGCWPRLAPFQHDRQALVVTGDEPQA
jgi:hypothetical protein